MGLDTLFYRMIVVWLSAITAGACGVIVARGWLRAGSGNEREGKRVSVWAVILEMITNLAFIVCAHTYSDYSQRVFDRLWVACLSLSTSFTVAALVVLIRSRSRDSKISKARMGLLLALNLLGAASILIRR